MMKFLVGFCILTVVAPTAFAEMKCSVATPEIYNEWIDLRGDCLTAMRNQIQKEIDASYQYLAMAAYFSRDTVNRPGFADLFFKAAKEERQHGSKFIEYLSMRGQLTDSVTDLIRIPIVHKDEWGSCSEALEDALKLESEVTKSIRKVIQTCEKKYNYYHLTDYLTGDSLGEQLYGLRDFAGKLTDLLKIENSNGGLGEYLFDKEL